jgi:hypothetical protein
LGGLRPSISIAKYNRAAAHMALALFTALVLARSADDGGGLEIAHAA